MEYDVEKTSGRRLRITFTKRLDVTRFIRWDFYSRILHSLRPKENEALWVKGSRLPVEIRGWPKVPRWNRISDLELESDALPDDWLAGDYKQLSADLKFGTQYAIGKVEYQGVKFSVFHIGNHDIGWSEYRFQSASREVAALCMLYDLEPHPRNHIELWMEPDEYPPISNSPHSNWPKSVEENKRYFGDPSKAVESLEKMGWPRHGPDATSMVSRDVFQGSRQEIYQLTQCEQQLRHMRIRKDIPPKWRKEILERDDFTCLYCGRQYEQEDMNSKTGKHPQLDPDHRIPVNVKTDDSDDSTFLENLMTLCSTCNQRKREITKKFQQNDDHDWENEEWAYPDRQDFLARRLLSIAIMYSEKVGLPVDEAISELLENLG